MYQFKIDNADPPEPDPLENFPVFQNSPFRRYSERELIFQVRAPDLSLLLNR